MTIFGIGTLQLELATGDNLDQIESEVRLAKTRLPWLDMVLIPELAAFGPLIDKAQPLPGPAEQRFQDIARSTGLWLVAGSLYERTIEGVYNTTPVINPAGEVVARHRKIYPFLPYERGVLNGNICTVFDVPGVARFGISNCYDMWFPETTRTLASLGDPAPEPDQHHRSRCGDCHRAGQRCHQPDLLHRRELRRAPRLRPVMRLWARR